MLECKSRFNKLFNIYIYKNRYRTKYNTTNCIKSKLFEAQQFSKTEQITSEDLNVCPCIRLHAIAGFGGAHNVPPGLKERSINSTIND